MHKKFTFLVILALLIINSSCSNKKHDNSGFDVKFQTINGDDCHNCYGKIIVNKGSLVDTIKGGQWGKSVDYHTFNINSKEYLFTSFSYSYPMGERWNEYKIYSLESSTFMKKLFEKAVTPTNCTLNIIEIENGSKNDFNYYDIELKMENGVEVLG